MTSWSITPVYKRSTHPWALDTTPATELCMSRGLPRAQATISPSWNAWSMPSKRSRLTLASSIVFSGDTRPFDSAVAQARSKRVCAASAALVMPTPTSTLFSRSVTSAVSFETGGPGSLLVTACSVQSQRSRSLDVHALVIPCLGKWPQRGEDDTNPSPTWTT